MKSQRDDDMPAAIEERRTRSLCPGLHRDICSPGRAGIFVALLAVAVSVLKDLAREALAHANDEFLRRLGWPAVVGLFERTRDVGDCRASGAQVSS